MFAVAKGGEELAEVKPKGKGRGEKEIQRKTEIVLSNEKNTVKGSN